MVVVDPERFEDMVVVALDGLPDARRLMRNVAVTVEHGPGPPGLLGLYEGVPLTSRTSQYAGVLPDRITIYRLAICAVCATEDDVADQVRRTVVHEVGHHFGIGDERLREARLVTGGYGVGCGVVLPHVTATRYVTPLREGGSLPGLMEADDLGTYVVKFRGAGQGRKALIAEVVSARLARACGLAVPDLVTVELNPALAAGEPDQEVQDLLRASAGLNLGMDFLPGALDFDTAAGGVDAALAGRVLWFDALTGNADRSWRNPNMLLWHGTLFLIDHGATLTFHHRWATAAAAATRPYDASEHALIGCGPLVDEADAALAGLVTEDVLRDAAAQIPGEWLDGEPGFDGPGPVRDAYVSQLASRLDARPAWLPGLRAAAAAGPAAGPRAGARPGGPAWLAGPPGGGVPGGGVPGGGVPGGGVPGGGEPGGRAGEPG